jgi:hypothetical protein
MAFTATTEWDVRTTGNDANGGGFDVASSGTDYSQQDAAQVSFTDLVIDAVTNTKCTSAANPFTAAHVGNIIKITAGTGFTVQRVQIVSVTAGVATCDKSLGTLASTGGTGKLGGAVLTLAQLCGSPTICVSGNTVHVKAGTYALTASVNLDSAGNNASTIGPVFVGYQAAHRDGGTRPLITTSTNAIRLFIMGPGYWQFVNINFSNTAATRADGFWWGGTSPNGVAFRDCILDGFVLGVNGDNNAGGAGAVFFVHCEVKNCTSHGVAIWFSVYAQGSYFHNNTGAGIFMNAAGVVILVESIVAFNGAGGLGASSSLGRVWSINSVIALNTGSGIASAILTLVNTIVYGNTAWGLNGSTLSPTSANNAFGANTSGNYNPAANAIPLVAAFIALTANPFTNSAAHDFSLNSTAGGGAACKAAGLQWS